MDLIGGTLKLIENKLNEHFRNKHQDNGEWVIISNIVKQDGTLYDNAKDKIVMFLANIQHETIISTYNKNVPTSNNGYAAIVPPIYINLYLLFFANFSDGNYQDGLAMVSGTISFFQQYPGFTQDNLPGLNPEIDKLTFEMVNLDMTELSYLLGLAGTKYLPSVVYKVRMIPFLSNEIQGQTPTVQGLQDQAAPESEVLETERVESESV